MPAISDVFILRDQEGPVQQKGTSTVGNGERRDSQTSSSVPHFGDRRKAMEWKYVIVKENLGRGKG